MHAARLARVNPADTTALTGSLIVKSFALLAVSDAYLLLCVALPQSAYARDSKREGHWISVVSFDGWLPSDELQLTTPQQPQHAGDLAAVFQFLSRFGGSSCLQQDLKRLKVSCFCGAVWCSVLKS